MDPKRREEELLQVSFNISKFYELLRTKELTKQGREEIESEIFYLENHYLPSIREYDV